MDPNLASLADVQRVSERVCAARRCTAHHRVREAPRGSPPLPIRWSLFTLSGHQHRYRVRGHITARPHQCTVHGQSSAAQVYPPGKQHQAFMTHVPALWRSRRRNQQQAGVPDTPLATASTTTDALGGRRCHHVVCLISVAVVWNTKTAFPKEAGHRQAGEEGVHASRRA